MSADLQLLLRYQGQGDVAAFRDLVQAHAGMVFATALRVTRDDAMAQDVAQETFLQLAKQSRHITQSVAAWLHRVAWRRACNAVREHAARRRAESRAAELAAGAADAFGAEATWAELETQIDEVLDALPDKLREPLVMQFLQGRQQREIAAQLGVSQSTVSRWVDEGLAQLRAGLKTRGMLCAASLAALLTANSAPAAPPALLASLGKIGLSGVGSAAASSAGFAGAFWLKTGVALVVVAAGGILLHHRRAAESVSQAGLVAAAARSVPPPALPKAATPSAPLVAGTPLPALPAGGPAARPTPVHELVHSFYTPPKRPTGHLVQDSDGWLWGVTSVGGRYGMGTLYRMSPDGAVWEEKVSFNGSEGRPRGGYPAKSVTRGPGGRLWGMTQDPATLFSYDPRSGELITELALEAADAPQACPTVLPDGQVWFSTLQGIHRYDPQTRVRTPVVRREPPGPGRKPLPLLGELTPDGRGWLWAATSEQSQGGSVCKISIATGAWTQVIAFTGKAGAYPGRHPCGGLALGPDGCLWGTTRNGGETDQGTVFKIDAETGAFTSVAQFRLGQGVNTGIHPESMLADDGRGCLWGTATYGGQGASTGQGTIYKVERRSGKLSVVTRFSGLDGAAPGGVPRAHLLRAGPDHFVGVTGFWGKGWSGVIYRVHIPSGRYEVLKHLADVAETTDGEEPHGTLAEAADGSLWGTTFHHGAHHCGTVYRLDPATHQLVTRIHFTGKSGAHAGSNPDAGLVPDGLGWLWGTTSAGGAADAGTIFKVHEQTGDFVSVAQFGRAGNPLAGQRPMTELALDERGQLWGTAAGTVFKVDSRSHAVQTVVAFGGDLREPFGTARGRLVADGKGYVWGCALGDRKNAKASLFRIRTADAAWEVVRSFPSALAGWSGWHPSAQMVRDRGGLLWFTGVLEQGGRRPRVSLNRLDPATGSLRQHFSPQFPIIDTPVQDDQGRWWGASARTGRFDALYTFDPATGAFQTALEFTGHGSQARSGSQPMFGRPMRASDGNLYAVTRYGGPGNGGTIYRLRFGPTPMTQPPVILADGRVELHGVLRPNGRDSQAAFEWGPDPRLREARVIPAGTVSGGESAKSVQAVLSGLERGQPYYVRLRGGNPDNAMPQRGAILSFIVPLADAPAAAALAATGGPQATQAAAAAGAAVGSRHALKIIRVPGAGAGRVLGHLPGKAYEVGKSYTLAAQADNGYVFTHWSGPGIGGPAAENPKLDFSFTGELARDPVITATFVRNPFHPGLLGSYYGLVQPLEETPAALDNFGALELRVAGFGSFSGLLRLDGAVLPVAGVFDSGGRARFGLEMAFTAVLARGDQPALLLDLQLHLAETSLAGISGFVGRQDGQNAAWHARTHLSPIVPAATLVRDPVFARLGETGRLDLQIVDRGSGALIAPAQLVLQTDGRLRFSTTLPDAGVVFGEPPLVQEPRLSFFQAYPGGIFGVGLPLADLLKRPDEPALPVHGWWLAPGAASRPVTILPDSPVADSP